MINKQKIVLLLTMMITASSIAYAAKYTVNTSGTVKNQSGQIITSPANTVNQNYYNQPQNIAPLYNTQQNTVPQNNTIQYNVQQYDQQPISGNYFNNYQAQNYVASNRVNAISAGIVEFVMDYSGSMSNWIEIAKRSMASILAQIPSSTKVGFRVFGHDFDGHNPNGTVREIKKIIKQGKKLKVVTEKGCVGSANGACAATQLVAPITDININSLLSGMNSVNVGGATPLVYALDRAANQDLASFDTSVEKKIVLITDGGENCGGDPCAFAKKLMQKRSDIHIDVVLVSSSSKALSCLASATGGHIYHINNLADFSTVITQSMQAQPTIRPQTQNQKYEYVGN